MTKIDDLNVGDFIVISGVREEDYQPAWGSYDSPFGPPRQPVTPVLTGNPFRIEAISLPFLCVTDGHHRAGLDVRRFVFQRVTKEYVQAMVAGRSDSTIFSSRKTLERGDTHPLLVTGKKRKKKTKPDPKACRRCGSKMIERRMPYAKWQLVCPDCGFEGGPVATPDWA